MTKGGNYACPVCGASFSTNGGVVSPLKCWRTDCPGKDRPDRTKLKAVK